MLRTKQLGRKLASYAMRAGLCLSCAAACAQQSATPAAAPNAPDRAAAQPSDHQLTFQQRLRIYRNAVISPQTVLAPAFSAGIDQAEGEPPTWRTGAAGYGQRFGSELGQQVISQSIVFGFAAADHEDPRYTPSADRSVKGRIHHAIIWSLLSHTAGGHAMPAVSLAAGSYGAAFIANAWYPDSRNHASDALERGSTSLAAYIGFRLFQEFAPRFVRPLEGN